MSLFGIGESVQAAAQVASTAMTNAANLKINRENNEANAKLAAQQNQWNIDQWNRENQYNSAASQVARLEEAGINPLMLQGDAGSAAQLQSAELANQQATQIQDLPIADSINKLQQSALMEQEANKAAAEAEGQMIENGYKADQILTDLDLKNANIALFKQQYGFNAENNSLIIEQNRLTNKNLRATNYVLKEQRKAMKQNRKLAKKQCQQIDTDIWKSIQEVNLQIQKTQQEIDESKSRINRMQTQNANETAVANAQVGVLNAQEGQTEVDTANAKVEGLIKKQESLQKTLETNCMKLGLTVEEAGQFNIPVLLSAVDKIKKGNFNLTEAENKEYKEYTGSTGPMRSKQRGRYIGSYLGKSK